MKAADLGGRCYDLACRQSDHGVVAMELRDGIEDGVRQVNSQVAIEPTTVVAPVARAVSNLAHLHLDANVQSLTTMATKKLARCP